MRQATKPISVSHAEMLSALQRVEVGSPEHNILLAKEHLDISVKSSTFMSGLRALFVEAAYIVTGSTVGAAVGTTLNVMGIKVPFLDSGASTLSNYFTYNQYKSMYIDQPYYSAMAKLTATLGYAVPDSVVIGVASIITIAGFGLLSSTRSLTPAALTVGSYFLLGQTGVASVPTALAIGVGGSLGHYANVIRHPIAATGQALKALPQAAQAMMRPHAALKTHMEKRRIHTALRRERNRLGLGA